MTVELFLIDAWVIESLSGVMTAVLFALKFVVSVSYFVEVLSDVAVESLAVGTGAEVLAGINVNISAAATNALEFPMSIP